VATTDYFEVARGLGLAGPFGTPLTAELPAQTHPGDHGSRGNPLPRVPCEPRNPHRRDLLAQLGGPLWLAIREKHASALAPSAQQENLIS
jgi:hypothetical protein